MMTIDPWFVDHLVCPVDKGPVRVTAGTLCCGAGHRYPIVDGIPVMLVREAVQTISLANASLDRAANVALDTRAPDLYLESLGISDEEKRGVIELARRGSAVDPVVAYLVAATNGLMYRHLIGALDRYPIPVLPLPEGHGGLLLDVGCSWGRWTFAANDRGYNAVGIDPSLGAVMAARRVARQRGSANRYVVGDARFLPFADGMFDAVFSYSVLQHLAKADAATAVEEMGRILKPGGTAKVQLPTRFGVRCLYHQWRRGFREATGFEVRYWSVAEIRALFARAIGRVRVDVDGFFGIGLQRTDRPFMPASLKVVLSLSDALQMISRAVPPLVLVADSVFATATRSEPS